jgi:import inner membrane translocase subunit TIM17
MIGSAVVGGLILALIEGMGIMFTRMTADQFRPMGPPTEEPMNSSPPFGNQQYQ